MKTSDLIQVTLVAAFVIVLLLLFFISVPANNAQLLDRGLTALFAFIGGTGAGAFLTKKLTIDEQKGDPDEKNNSVSAGDVRL